MTIVRFVDSAEEEFLAEVSRYSEISSSLGADLIAETAAVLRRIEAFPEHGAPYLFSTRRVILRGFPFEIVYWLKDECAFVLAFANQHRLPGYWRDRFRSQI